MRRVESIGVTSLLPPNSIAFVCIQSSIMLSQRSKFISPLLVAAVACAIVALVAFVTFAQSGRRATKPASSTPASTPEASPGEKKPEAKPPVKIRPDLTLIVGADRGDLVSGIPPYFYDTVLQSCSRRLDDATGVHVDVQSHPMTR